MEESEVLAIASSAVFDDLEDRTKLIEECVVNVEFEFEEEEETDHVVQNQEAEDNKNELNHWV